MVEGKAVEDPAGGAKGSDQGGDNGQITVKIGEETKTLKADDVVNLLNQQAGLTQESQKVAAIRDAATKYGLDPEDYVSQAEGSFGALTKLFDAGVIDKDGNVLLGPGTVADPKNPKPGDGAKPIVPAAAASNVDEVAAAIEKRFGKTIEELTGRLTGLGKNVENTMKLQLKREILVKHPELNEADALNVLDYAQGNPKKDLWGHAKDAVEAKKVREKELDQHYAKKYGVDLDSWNKRNRLNEQDADGGGAAAVIVGKKVSFKAKAGDPDAVTPRQAAMEFLERNQRG